MCYYEQAFKLNAYLISFAVKAFNAEVRQKIPQLVNLFTKFRNALILVIQLVRCQTTNIKGQDELLDKRSHQGHQILQACRAKRRKVHTKGKYRSKCSKKWFLRVCIIYNYDNSLNFLSLEKPYGCLLKFFKQDLIMHDI